MRESGETTRQMERVNSGMLMEIFTKAPGRMTKLMDLEYTSMSMEHSTRGTGRMTCRMVKEWRAGKTAASMREATRRE